jgi:hypothetical protein
MDDIWIGIVLLVILISVCCWSGFYYGKKIGYDIGYAARGIELLDSAPDK